MEERVEVISAGVPLEGAVEEREVNGFRHGGQPRNEFISESPFPANYNDPIIPSGENLVRSVPSLIGQVFLPGLPIAKLVRTWGEVLDPAGAVSVPSGLHDGAVAKDGAGGAPRVGDEMEGPNGVAGNVVLDGVSVASWVRQVFPGALASSAVEPAPELEAGPTGASLVEEHDRVTVGQGHVHCHNSGVFH
ncbi:unnamed protein product [Cuscuta epithymum]|uniref:Uncharacterized protein n=1 Tax=Cuscuta epithymum TaxID=186058 RepID=A0AAV0CN09_9ASTE|nr:unnamed protein product [Cuscuta epithymum]